MLKYFSMFSGIGGFELGLENSNYDFECVGYSEVDKYAISIYRKNFPEHKCFGDATKIRTEELPDFDLLVGGFPCQAFSVAGKRRGFSDTRGTLFFEIARVLRDKRPRYFLLENVKGLLSHEKGKTFQTILEILSEMGYDVTWQVYNSKNHGTPQNRERVFIKGYLRSRCGREILCKGLSSEENSRKIESKAELIQINDKAGQAQKVYDIKGIATTLCANGGGQGGKTGLYVVPTTKEGKAFAVTTRPRSMPLSKKQDNYVIKCESEKTVCRPVLTPDRVKKRQNGRRMKEDGEPAFTLTAQDRHGIFDGFRVRRLTPLECERLQAFPDNWTKFGVEGEKISDTQRYKTVGNAVTTTVITAIANEMFEEDNENGNRL